MRFALLAAALVLSIPSQVHAEQACTEIGCVNGIVLRTDPGFDWKYGRYNFDFSLDYKTVKCVGSLPLKPCEEKSIRCDDPSVTITESGCALPQSAHAFGDIHINDDPRKLIVRIMRNNQPLVTKTVIVNYQESQPNGPECGPVCKSATYDLFFSGND